MKKQHLNKSERKQHKKLRDAKKGNKNLWQSAA